MNPIPERLKALRARMKACGVDAYYIPTEDPHQSEYVPLCWQRRAWISNFTGSAGYALVGLDKAWLWADSRYHLQGEAELAGTGITLVKMGAPGEPTLGEIIEREFAGKTFGIDSRVVSCSLAARLEKMLLGCGAALHSAPANLVDDVWQDRPSMPDAPAVVWPEAYAGRSVADKLKDLRAAMTKKRCAAHVVSMLDAVAWLFNIRGADVPYNPVVISYALVTETSATLFTDPARVGADVRAHLSAGGVELRPYDDFAKAIGSLKGRVWVDDSTVNLWIADSLRVAGAELVEAESPITLAKARKNKTEQAGMRAAHERDGVAVIRFLHWLESAWRKGDLDEIKAAERLRQFRAEGELCVGPSFETISGFQSNGAIVHYRVSPATNKKIDDSAIYLVDSGGQYLDGTTDITRTLHLGAPTKQEIEHYTLVLKGHLALRLAVFPRGTAGPQVDILARKPLWEKGLNFGHGTGHGVGCHLNVHEGPHRIAPGPNTVGLDPGMVVSNEPGFYLAGKYGIRVENLIMVVEKPELSGPFGAFYGFEDLTLVPHCRKLIDPALLSAEERAELNAYHKRVHDTLAARVPAEVRPWLADACASL